jgi:hypothetical protein
MNEWKTKNPDKVRQHRKNYHRSPEQKLEDNKNARARYRKSLEENPEETRAKNRENALKWSRAHPEVGRARSRKRNIENPDYARDYYHNTLSHRPQYRLNNAMHVNIYNALKDGKNGRGWEELVGYNIDELKSHLEARFRPGMTWENYGYYGWHIDHIIPKASFKYESADDPEFKKCWSLKNLQPLWAEENFTKSSRRENQIEEVN